MSGDLARAEEIAKGLTHAQQRLLEWLDPKDFYDWGSRGAPGNRTTRIRLLEKGVTERGDKDWMRRLSPLGLAVREILLRDAQP